MNQSNEPFDIKNCLAISSVKLADHRAVCNGVRRFFLHRHSGKREPNCATENREAIRLSRARRFLRGACGRRRGARPRDENL